MQALKDNLKKPISAQVPKIEKSSLKAEDITKLEFEPPKKAKLGFVQEADKEQEISSISKGSASFQPKSDYNYSELKKSEEAPPSSISSRKKVDVISTNSTIVPLKMKEPYQKIFEKVRYTLIDVDKLTAKTKNQAHKKNLDNITKSGLKQLQVQLFHIIFKMI